MPFAMVLLSAVPGRAFALPQADVEQEYQLAAGMYQREQWDEASAAFERIIRDFPNTNEAALAHFFVGESLVQEARYDDAYIAFQKYLTRLPDHEFAGRARFRMGEAAYKVGNQQTALRLLETYLRDDQNAPLAAFALSYLGELRLQRNEPQLAERVFEAALKVNPAGPIANQSRFGLARSLQKLNRIADAERFYEFIVAEPDNPLATSARLQLGIISFANKQLQEAESQLLQVTNAADSIDVSAQTLAEANYWLARTAIAKGESGSAIQYFSEIDADVIDSELAVAAWFDGAMVAWSQDDAGVAMEWLSKLQEKSPAHDLADDAHAMEIRILRKTERNIELDHSIERFVTIHSISPLLAEVLETRGRRAYEREDYSSAIKTFSRLLTSDRFIDQQNDPAITATWSYFQSLAHLGLKEYRNAESLLVSINRDDLSETIAPLVEITLAKIRFAQKKHSLSIPNYQRYLQLSSDRDAIQQARYELTLALAHDRQWPAAVESFMEWTDAPGISNGDEKVANTVKLLVSLANKHQQHDSVRSLYQWMSSDDQSADVASAGLAGLAWLQLDDNDEAAAMATFAELLSRYPDSEQAAVAGMASAKWHEGKQQWQAAADAYSEVVTRFADSDSGRLAMLRQGLALHKLSGERNLQNAKVLVSQWLEHAKTSTSNDDLPGTLRAEALYQLGWICRDLGNTGEGNRYFSDLFRQFPASKYWPDATWRLANDDVKANRFDEALQKLDRLATRDGVSSRILVRSLFLRGTCFAKSRRWHESADAFEALLAQVNSGALQDKAIYWLAESCYQLQQYDKSSKQFQKLHGDPARRISEALRPWVALRLAQCHAKSENWSLAGDIATVARQRYANFQLTYEYDYLIGRGLEDAGQLKAAIDRYQRVIESGTGGNTETAAMSQWRIGEVHFHQEDYVSAIKAYYRVDSLFAYAHWRAAALLQAGKCQEHLQNWKHAQKLYTQLLQQFPNSEFAVDARGRLTRAQAVARQAAKSNSQGTPPRALSR